MRPVTSLRKFKCFLRTQRLNERWVEVVTGKKGVRAVKFVFEKEQVEECGGQEGR